MREKIILASGINGDELLRSLASNNVNCFNVRIMNAVGLARYAIALNKHTNHRVFVKGRTGTEEEIIASVNDYNQRIT